ncbi:MAG: hypothetical protein JRN15_21175 [Nitrososphaerota archaeon]|nr:hypothetical protein [Nitrososphaerota archaeon]
MKTYWMSFVGDEGNRGVAIVDAEDEQDALTVTKRLNINPGGEVAIVEVPQTTEALAEINGYGKNRLIPTEELLRGGNRKVSQLNDEEREFVNSTPLIRRICPSCNQ